MKIDEINPFLSDYWFGCSMHMKISFSISIINVSIVSNNTLLQSNDIPEFYSHSRSVLLWSDPNNLTFKYDNIFEVSVLYCVLDEYDILGLFKMCILQYVASHRSLIVIDREKEKDFDCFWHFGCINKTKSENSNSLSLVTSLWNYMDWISIDRILNRKSVWVEYIIHLCIHCISLLFFNNIRQ